MAQETDLKSVGLIACGFKSRLRYQPGKHTLENWELRRGLNYQMVQGSVHELWWLHSSFIFTSEWSKVQISSLPPKRFKPRASL